MVKSYCESASSWQGGDLREGFSSSFSQLLSHALQQKLESGVQKLFTHLPLVSNSSESALKYKLESLLTLLTNFNIYIILYIIRILKILF